MSFSYSTATWRWYVWLDNKVASDFFEHKHEADKIAAEIGGKVRKTRW